MVLQRGYRWILWTALSAGLGAVGCQSGPRTQAYVEMVNAERRGLEDRVYALEYDLETVERQLESYRAENERLRRELSGDDSDHRGAAPPQRPPRRAPGGDLPPPRSSAPRSKGRIDTSPPVIEFGDPDESGPPATTPPMAPPKGSNENSDAPRRTGGTPATLDSSDLPNQASLEEPIPLASPSNAPRELPIRGAALRHDAGSAAYIVLDPTITGGADFDDEPGDDGVSIGLAVRDDQGRPVKVTGALSAVLLDPAHQGAAARVARWDLDATQVARLLRGQTADAVTFHMAWTDAPPEHDRLKLFVRYETPDGRRLEAEREITVRPSSSPVPGHRVTHRDFARPHSVEPSHGTDAKLPARPPMNSPASSVSKAEPTPASNPALSNEGWRPKSGGRVVPASAQEPIQR